VSERQTQSTALSTRRQWPAALRRRRDGAGEPPRLVLRFAVQAAIVLAVGAGIVLLFVRDWASERAEESVRFHAEYVAHTILRDELLPSDFGDPVGRNRRDELDRLFRNEVLGADTLRVNLYNPQGQVTYSTDDSLMGRVAKEETEEVMHGTPESEIGHLSDDGGAGGDVKILEAYVPVYLGDSTDPVGVFELYQDYAPVAVAARDAFKSIATVFAGVLLALYLALIPLLQRVTRRLRRQMGEIHHQAFHDGLTELPNRALFRDRVEQSLRFAGRAGQTVAVMLIDLDRFKEINDTLGHQSGDALLKALGVRIRAQLRGSDTIARLGGDEFGILAVGADAAGAIRLAETLRTAIREPIFVADLELQVDASIGIAVFPDHGVDCETLIRFADMAMYLSKKTHQPALYSAEHDHYSPERLTLMGDLRRALESDELVVYYQPQASLATGEVGSVEALVRWQHPTRGLIPPDQFIPLAEHSGLIRPLTRYVLDRSLCQCRAWLDAGLRMGVAVNVSGRDLLDLSLPDEVAELLERWDVDASLLELEITENTILTDPIRARAVLNRLSDIGISLAIDDFGSGHSSLGYLKRLPVDVLKIDRSFVIGMGSDENDAIIVRSTIDLGHNLGLRVVAEGVEDAASWDKLAELRCDTAQGYHLGRPVPADQLEEQLEEQRAARRVDTQTA
jgi:diguanylate cyclase (GGDEF)-like protein